MNYNTTIVSSIYTIAVIVSVDIIVSFGLVSAINKVTLYIHTDFSCAKTYPSETKIVLKPYQLHPFNSREGLAITAHIHMNSSSQNAALHTDVQLIVL